ncbi:MAG TPA: Tm-1-like ATP-binding domain-containing protein [Solirubrobacteraceae bacterium]
MPSHTQPGRIIVAATLDTKGEEARFVADAIRGRGHTPVLVDLSLGPGGDTQAGADITREDIASEAATTVDALAGLPRAEAMEVVARGAAALIARAATGGAVHAALGIGGGTGTWLASEIFAALPHGFPKLIVSTLTGRDASRDITVMPSVVDIAGLNRLLTPVLANAAAAVCGMAEGVQFEQREPRPTIALTMFGVTTEGATHLRRFLTEADCEVVVFHANGAGGQTMERLAREGAFQAVIDWTTSEITDELTGGICTAGPDRLESAGQMGVPQVVVPGAIDVINVLAPIPEQFAGRTHHWHLPTVPLIRTSARESREIGAWMANKLNSARGPVRVLVPGHGFSSLDRPGGVFEDTEADTAWENALRAGLRDGIPVEVLPWNINEEPFARAVADAVLTLLDGELVDNLVGNPVKSSSCA